jgi:hypothetical protein
MEEIPGTPTIKIILARGLFFLRGEQANCLACVGDSKGFFKKFLFGRFYLIC